MTFSKEIIRIKRIFSKEIIFFEDIINRNYNDKIKRFVHP